VVSDSNSGPATGKGQAAHDRIVAAAAELIYLYGLSGTKLENVRTASATSGSQMSRHVGSRQGLVGQVLIARRREMLSFHHDERFKSFDTIEALQAWADACATKLEGMGYIGGCVYGSLVSELLPRPDEALRAMITEGYDAWMSIFNSGFSAMRDRGELREDADPKHLAATLVCAHQGSAALSQTLGSCGPMHSTLDAAVAYVRSFLA
jgi:TetR/AcrR family transcriptional regulator, transcriptional repressor for nem operon